jgi:hypothetical protein
MMHLIVMGCGTVGYSILSAFLLAPLAQKLSRVTLIDQGHVRPHNAITCPGYTDFNGLSKPAALLGVCADRLPPNLDVDLYCRSVEDLDWTTLLNRCSSAGRDDGPVLVVMGLDDWQSRLCVIEALRGAQTRVTARITAVQVGLDRGEAQVSIFGNRWEDPCPACGLSVLPSSEPCVVNAGDGLVRGDLKAEARVATGEVMRLAALVLADEEDLWVNTKINLVSANAAMQFVRYRRARHSMNRCVGPHASETPLSPSQLFVGIVEEEVNHV